MEKESKVRRWQTTDYAHMHESERGREKGRERGEGEGGRDGGWETIGIQMRGAVLLQGLSALTPKMHCPEALPTQLLSQP